MIAVTGRVDLGATDFPSFDGYVRKPITFELLESVLEEWRVDRQPPANQPAQAGSPEVAATNAQA
jgi:two-component system OmpR family response regulator